MKYILQPKWKKCVYETTVYTDTEYDEESKTHTVIKSATCTESFRYEEFEVELAEGVDVEDLKTWNEFELDDTSVFSSYEQLDNPVTGDGCSYDAEEFVGLTDEEITFIEDNEVYETTLQPSSWHTVISCECEIVPVS